jgi:dTDP-4-dehydrorhamnose 3,5-epimerase
MQFHPTLIRDAFVIELQPSRDHRGSFARLYCREEFRARGLPDMLVQCNIAWNRRRGTLRGMHYTRAPSQEAKLVRCSRGRIYDVLLDLRVDSPSFRQWIALELKPDDGRLVYVPPGIAHGYQTLTDDTEISYWMSDLYRPGCQAGVRWNDPAFGIEWPVPQPILSNRDRRYPDFPDFVPPPAGSRDTDDPSSGLGHGEPLRPDMAQPSAHSSN